MTARRVLLLRHGITDYNHNGRFQGQADVALNAEGYRQAAGVADRLVDAGITAIVSSDLMRASETARVIGERYGLSVTLDARLQEINVGSWSGLTADQVGDVDPELWDLLVAGEDVQHSLTGETATAAGLRVADAISHHTSAAGPDDVLLVVGHGLTSRVASMLLIGLDYAGARRFAGIGNCHWVTLRPRAPHWQLVAYNQS